MFYYSLQRSYNGFLGRSKKRVVTSADCEIIDVEPLSFKVPEKAEKRKVVAMVPQKRKENLPQVPEKS